MRGWRRTMGTPGAYDCVPWSKVGGRRAQAAPPTLMKQHLIVSVGTPNQHPPSPYTPLFRPLGSVQPNVQPPGRPSTSH